MTDITGPNRLPRLSDLDTSPDEPDETEAIRLRCQALFQARMIQRDPHLLEELLHEARAEGEAYGRAYGHAEATMRGLELQHILERPEIPAPLIVALQRGPDPSDPLGGTSFCYAGIVFTVTVSRHGTGTPIPDSYRVWMLLREVIVAVTNQPYCARVIAPLPPEITTVAWTDSQGRLVRVLSASR